MPPINSENTLHCIYASICSGCDRIDLSRSELENDRRTELKRLGLDSAPVDFKWIQAGGLRDRLEFTLQPALEPNKMPPRLGLFKRVDDQATDFAQRDVVDIDRCPQLSPGLQSWLEEFRRDLPSVMARRSVRLRVSPGGLRGVWLDFANEDIRDLLDDGAWLNRQLERDVIVEVGQKRKRVVKNLTGPRAHRLEDPVLESWFETSRANVFGDYHPTPLFATIGTFTQPGFQANRALVETVLQHIGPRPQRVAEFGAGIGNFTLPLLALGASVHVFESDRLAIEALKKGVVAAGLESAPLQIHAGDFILSKKAADRAFGENLTYDTVVVDPPRPGLGMFIDSIVARAEGARWVYVSCYPESLAKDAEALRERGWALERLTVVEQFPFTRHFEIVASFTKADLPQQT